MPGGFESLSVEAARKAEHDTEVAKRAKSREISAEASAATEGKAWGSAVAQALASRKRGRPRKDDGDAAAAAPAAPSVDDERARQAALLAKYAKYAQARHPAIVEAVGGVPPNPKWTADEAQAQLDRVRHALDSAGSAAMVRQGLAGACRGLEWVVMDVGVNPNNMYELRDFGDFMGSVLSSEEHREALQPELSELECEAGALFRVPYPVRLLSKLHELMLSYSAGRRESAKRPRGSAPESGPVPPAAPAPESK
jgi:hypothetical protein